MVFSQSFSAPIRAYYVFLFILFFLCFLLYQIVKVYDNNKVEVNTSALNSYVTRQHQIQDRWPADGLSPNKLAELHVFDDPVAITVKYAIVIDAGSAGTRIHVYSIRYINNVIHSLLNDVYVEISKPLSLFVGREDKIEDEIFSRLLHVAKKNVPTELYKHTPVSVKATAGLRLLSSKASEKILEKVRSIIAKWPFVPENNNLKDAVSIIEGKEEGIWGWITLNFLLGKIGNHKAGAVSEIKTVGSIDLGGGSVQVVLEISPEAAHSLSAAHKQFLTEISFVGKKFHLFQNSFLRYGVNEARREIQKYETNTFAPCTPANGKHHIDVLGCNQNVKKYLNLDVDCMHPTCFFAGIPSPSRSPFRGLQVYAFSAFQDRLHPLVYETENRGENFQLSINEIWNLILSNCDFTPRSKAQSSLELAMVLQKFPNYCSDNVYIYTLLTDGFKIQDQDFRINFVKKINGFEACWALGAAINMIETNY